MKRIVYILILFLLCLPAFSTKRALLVGIGSYPPNSGWNNISSVNDVHILKKCLSNDFVIETLLDHQATRKGINEAFNRLSMNCVKGDTVLIHFSCHGQQMLSNQSNEPDGLDEALVPYDAKCVKSQTYGGENHLLDNDLAMLLTSIRERIGEYGLLIVTLDACYSDSSHRGEKEADSVVYRGGAEIFGSNEISKDSLITVINKQHNRDESPIETLDGASNMIMLSACESFQKNKEIRIGGQGYGCLSYSMLKAFDSCGFGDVSIWLDNVLEYMNEYAYTQTPQVRSTIGYVPPRLRTSECGEDSSDTDCSNSNWLLITICLIVLFATACVIWKKKRKK